MTKTRTEIEAEINKEFEHTGEYEYDIYIKPTIKMMISNTLDILTELNNNIEKLNKLAVPGGYVDEYTAGYKQALSATDELLKESMANLQK